MSIVRESDWVVERKKYYDNGMTLTTKTPTLKKIVLDTALVIGGAYIMYGIGSLIGEGLDHVPYVNHYLPLAVNYVSGINVEGNLDGLVGLICGISGATKSGTTVSEKTLNLEKVSIQPLTMTLRQ